MQGIHGCDSGTASDLNINTKWKVICLFVCRNEGLRKTR